MGSCSSKPIIEPVCETEIKPQNISININDIKHDFFADHQDKYLEEKISKLNKELILFLEDKCNIIDIIEYLSKYNNIFTKRISLELTTLYNKIDIMVYLKTNKILLEDVYNIKKIFDLYKLLLISNRLNDNINLILVKSLQHEFIKNLYNIALMNKFMDWCAFYSI